MGRVLTGAVGIALLTAALLAGLWAPAGIGSNAFQPVLASDTVPDAGSVSQASAPSTPKDTDILARSSLTGPAMPAPEEIELARLAIKESGGLKKSMDISKKHAERAKELILKTMLNKEIMRFFIAFIDYIEESLEWYS